MQFSLVKVRFLFWSPVQFILTNYREEYRGWCSANRLLNHEEVSGIQAAQNPNKFLVLVNKYMSEVFKILPFTWLGTSFMVEQLICPTLYASWNTSQRELSKCCLKRNGDSYFYNEVLVAVTSTLSKSLPYTTTMLYLQRQSFRFKSCTKQKYEIYVEFDTPD